MNQQDIAQMNKTARPWRATVVSKFLNSMLPNLNVGTVLDFGAGPRAIQKNALQAQHPTVVFTAHECGDNITDEHDALALSQQYDLVYASNVINVQPSVPVLRETAGQIAGAVKVGGWLVFNYPASPRKLSIPLHGMVTLFKRHGFDFVMCRNGVVLMRRMA